MKTLFVSPQVPWPLDAGSKIRIDQLLRSYRELGEVTVVCFAQSDAELNAVSQLERMGDRVWCIPFANAKQAGARGGRWGVLAKTLEPVPSMIQSFGSLPLRQEVARLLCEGFDLVHVQRLAMTANLPLALVDAAILKRPWWVLDVDDVESEKAKRTASMDAWHSRQKYLRLLEAWKLGSYERRVLPCFDSVLVCSEKDRLALRRDVDDGRVRIFSNGADVSRAPSSSAPLGDGRTLLFLGAMGYAPNDDAVRYFAREVFPLIRRRVADARLVVAGKSPSTAVQGLHDGQSVCVVGYVEDTAATFAASTVAIVPLRLGGGTRIKILEAMANGTPVVSTGIGAEGLDAVAGRDLLIADTAEAFANACSLLLLNPKKRAELASAGRLLVEGHYQWEEIRRGYINDLRSRLSTFRAP